MKKPIIKLKHKYETELKVINQPVYIRDIFVYQDIERDDMGYRYSLTFGEKIFKSVHYHEISVWQRLVDHIEVLANIAARAHEHYYCQPSSSGFQIKEDCQNNITRISTSEFSFYNDKPFTLPQLSLLTQTMELMAQKHYDNIHLLVSSLPIVTDDKTVLNVCLYIQCGKNPIISCFTKTAPSLTDPTFPETKSFSQMPSRRNHLDKAKQFTAETALIISNQSVIQIKTLGGAVYTQAVDICLDYQASQALKVLFEELSYSPSKNTGLFPLQADHIVTSNYTFLEREKNITSTVIIDPRMSKIQMPKPCSDTDFLNSADLNLEPPYEKEKTYIRSASNGSLLLFNPPFGSTIDVIVYEQRKLGDLQPTFKMMAENFNDEAMRHFATIHLRNHSPEFILIQQKFSKCVEFINYVNKILDTTSYFESIKPSIFTGRIFTGIYVRCHMNEFIESIPLLNSDPEIFLKEFYNPLMQLKNKLERTDNQHYSVPNLINPMIGEIEALRIILAPHVIPSPGPIQCQPTAHR